MVSVDLIDVGIPLFSCQEINYFNFVLNKKDFLHSSFCEKEPGFGTIMTMQQRLRKALEWDAVDTYRFVVVKNSKFRE